MTYMEQHNGALGNAPSGHLEIKMLNIDIKNHSGKFEVRKNSQWFDNHVAVVNFENSVPKSVLDVAYDIDSHVIPLFDGMGSMITVYEVTLVMECDLNNPWNTTTQKKMDMSKDIFAQLNEKLGEQQ